YGLVSVVMLRLLLCVFFFSSRRRHTRLVSDWSSDVCSSDLAAGRGPGGRVHRRRRAVARRAYGRRSGWPWRPPLPGGRAGARSEIGRASCRERVEVSVGGGSVKKKESG